MAGHGRLDDLVPELLRPVPEPRSTPRLLLAGEVVARPGANGPLPAAVALVARASRSSGRDVLGHFRVDQCLEHELDALADHVDVAAGAVRVQQLDHARLGEGTGFSVAARLAARPEIAKWPTSSGGPASTALPWTPTPLPLDLNLRLSLAGLASPGRTVTSSGRPTRCTIIGPSTWTAFFCRTPDSKISDALDWFNRVRSQVLGIPYPALGSVSMKQTVARALMGQRWFRPEIEKTRGAQERLASRASARGVRG